MQDYHLTLVPRMLADLSPDMRIAHFSHTPWAPPDYYRMLPDDVGREVLDGILGADHAGFLCQRWADSFMDCCEVILGASVDRARQRVTHRGHVTGIGVHPLGVDAEQLIRRAAEADVQARVAALAAAAGASKLIVRIDRTELSKNIVRGLVAYRELLVTHPEWHGRVTHVAFAYPSRHDLPEYREYTARVQRLASEITDEFGTVDWDPLILAGQRRLPRSLAAYRLADVLLVNPIRDGMNLVAKEGPILSERGCALVLSREAGAAAELGADALMVNPYDVTGTAGPCTRRCSCRIRTQEPARLPGPRGRGPAAQQWFADQLAALDRYPDWPERASIAASEPSSSAATPPGPSTTRSASAASVVTSPPRCNGEARDPVGAQLATAAKPAGRRGRLRRTSPRAALRSACKIFEGFALVPARRPQLDDQPAGLAPRDRSGRPARPAGSRSSASARSGSAARRVCTASASPLSSVQVPSGAPAAASTPGRSRAGRGHARRRRAASSGPRPPSAPCRSGPARSGPAPGPGRRARPRPRPRPAGDHGQRADGGASRCSAGDRARVRAGGRRVGARSATACRRSPGRSAPGPASRSSAARPARPAAVAGTRQAAGPSGPLARAGIAVLARRAGSGAAGCAACAAA